jgi:membrane associated rhomboid family serine protease
MLGQNTGYRFGGPVTPVVKKLMIANGAIFLLQMAAGLMFPNAIERNFGLSHQGLIDEFKFWQIFTYMFLHGGFFHVLMNLFTLWMFSGELETMWGGRIFLRYYLFSGMGAGVFIAIMNYITCSANGICTPVTLGASGAVYAILLAYGMTWPNREVLLYFLVPVKMKYLVFFFGLIEFFGTLSSGPGTNISHIGHIGGLISGFFFILYWRKKGFSGAGASKPGFFSSILRKQRLEKKKKDIETRIEAKKIIDSLLEKIAREGMQSLTKKDKKQLDWARKHYYPDNNEILH